MGGNVGNYAGHARSENPLPRTIRPVAPHLRNCTCTLARIRPFRARALSLSLSLCLVVVVPKLDSSSSMSVNRVGRRNGPRVRSTDAEAKVQLSAS